MKIRIFLIALVMLWGTASLRGGTPGYAYCGTYGSYVLMYKSNDQLEELGHLRCGEKVEVLSRWLEYVQVRTADGRVGWVHYSGISNNPSTTSGNFGVTGSSGTHAVPTVPPLTNMDITKMHVMHIGAD